MSFPVFVQKDNGKFVATLAGSPEMRAEAPTREDALTQLRLALEKRLFAGELVFLEVPTEGIMAAAGSYRDDPFLLEICEQIYRERDAEPKE